MIHIIGGGLAGSEAAWQAAELGVDVTIHEMRGVRPTAVHKTDALAELVCSNSFRADKVDNAVGLIKEEMRRLGSIVMRLSGCGSVSPHPDAESPHGPSSSMSAFLNDAP